MDIQQSQPIPVEKGWPLLGVLPKFLSGDPYEYLRNIMLERGDFVQINFGTQPVYLVSHPDYLQRILRDNYENYRKPDIFYNTFREIGGNGLAVSNGEFWLRQRRMIQPYLHRKALVNLCSEMTEAIAEILDGWDNLAENGTQVELGETMGDVSMNVILRTMFGKGTLPADDLAEIGSHIRGLFKYAGAGSTFYSSMVPKWFPIPGRREFLDDLNAVRKTVNHIITKWRQEKESSASLIQMMISAVDEESQEQMTEQQLFDEVLTIFLAGYESTATALSWLGVVVGSHPEVMAKLQAEIDQVLGGRNPSFEDMYRLTYTRQVFMEVLRMYTIAPFLPRALNQADQLGNYHLPANALLLVFYHGVHHNPHVWDRPEVFDPERFTPERIAQQQAFSYVPFSAGPRKCVGDEFVLFEGPLIMAMIFQKYKIHVVPNQTFPAKIGASMRPAKGVKVTFSLRTST